MRRFVGLGVVVVTLAATFPALGQNKPILAVMEIEDKTGKFEGKDLEAATNYLSTLLVTSGKYSVVEKGRQEAKKKQVVKNLKRETYDACYDDKCRIELGRALAADTLLACSIIGMGKSCTLTCRMVPLEKEVADKAGAAELECGADALPGAVKSVVEQLTREESPRSLRKAESDGGRLKVAGLTGVSIEMSLIRAGAFVMGSPASEAGRDKDEIPHGVTITRSFYLSKTEVTQGQWEEVMGTNPSGFRLCGENCPVESVNWYEALAFANALSVANQLPECYELSGCKNAPGQGMVCKVVRFVGVACTGFRLPTEGEWEFAARAGTTGATYAGRLTLKGKHNIPELDPIAWYGGNSRVEYPGGFDCSDWEEKQYDASLCGPHPVATKWPNSWKLHDMLGNIWEWVWDWKGDYPQRQTTDPTGPRSGSQRVVRGGSWGFAARFCRSSDRDGATPDFRAGYVGFRIARTAP